MAGKRVTRTLCSLFVLMLACGTLLAQQLKVAPRPDHASPVVPFVDNNSKSNVTIFSNLGPTPTNLYNAAAGGYYVCGMTCAALATDQWIALPFTNKVADHATQIQAAIGYISGTKTVKLGIYTDNAGTVGTVLAEASTSQIPNSGVCCQLAKVTIPPTALTASTQYWIVASADDVGAPDFEGVFQPTNQATIGGDVSQSGWFTFSGLVPAAAVKGTVP